VTGRCTIDFSGASEGVERLTWGQRVIWQAVEAYLPGDEPRCSALAVDVPEGAGRAEVLAAVRELVLRHEGLRTTFQRDAAGEPMQVVAGAGRIPVELSSDAGLDRGAAWARMRRTHFPEDGWPLRTLLVERAGRPCVLAVGFSHLAVDEWSAGLLARELATLLQGLPAGPPRRQPREQARYERSAAGQRALAASLRHWREQLAGSPQTMLIGPARPNDRSPRQRAVLRSASLTAALAMLARGSRVTPAAALLAALSFVLAARVSDHQPSRFSCLLTVGHRVRPELRDYVGTTVHHAPACFPIDAGSLIRTARAAMPAVLAATRYGQADSEAVEQLVRETAAQRGVHMEWVVVNVLARGRPAGGRAWAPDGWQPAELEWLPTVEPGRSPCELELVQFGELTTLELSADPVVVPVEQFEPLLRGLELLLGRAAGGADPAVADAAAVPGLAGAGQTVPLVRIDGCLVDPGEVNRLLADAVAPAASTAFVERPLGGRPRITGYVGGQEATLTLEAVHRRCLALLPGRPAAMAPQAYVLCRTAPRDLGDRDGWARQQVRYAGSGRASVE
jgi:hypothetical protein